MPKLIIKHDLPEPSRAEKAERWLRSILPLLFLLMIGATAAAFYVSQRPTALTQLPQNIPAALQDTPLTTPDVDKSVLPVVPPPAPTQKTVAAPEKPANLPEGFCPLFGPGAAECKANAKN